MSSDGGDGGAPIRVRVSVDGAGRLVLKQAEVSVEVPAPTVGAVMAATAAGSSGRGTLGVEHCLVMQKEVVISP